MKRLVRKDLQMLNVNNTKINVMTASVVNTFYVAFDSEISLKFPVKVFIILSGKLRN